MTASEKRRLALICLAVAIAVGWIPLHLYNSLGLCRLFLGIIGAIPFMLLNGVHGDMKGIRGIVGGVLFILVNAAVYYAISSYSLKRIRLRKRKKASSTSAT
jgi:hypothetical protein